MNFFNYVLTAIKSLPAKGRKNSVKILALGVGLAVSLVLLTKVCFEQTFDNFYEGADRVCYVTELYTQKEKEQSYDQTAGGIASRLKEHYPQIEEAMRFTYAATNTKAVLKDSPKKASVNMAIMADSCFFKILNRPCLAGDLTETLGVGGNAVISSSLAMRLADSRQPMDAAAEVIGKVFTLESEGDGELTITGVFEDYPANSSYRPDVVASLAGISTVFGQYDGTNGVVGNDRYKTLIRLSSKAAIAEINAAMGEFVNRYLPVEQLKAAGYGLSFSIRPYESYHNEDNNARSMMLVLTLVAVALLLTSVLNYMLIVVSTSVGRSREMALRKCLGSDTKDMYSMMTAESLVHTVLASLLAVVLIYLAKGTVENLTGTAVADLFVGGPLLLAVFVVIVVFLINAFVPAALFNRIPVATIFRNFVAGKRIWKQGLLAVEFGAVAFLGVLLSIISLQYNKLMSADLGFDSEHTASVHVSGLKGSQKNALATEIRSLAHVVDATLCYQHPFSSYSGNNVRLPGQDEDLFNLSDAYMNDGHWVNTLGIKIVKGTNLMEGKGVDEEVLIDTNCEESLKVNTGWSDVMGKQILVSSHEQNKEGSVITGVFEPISQGLIKDDDGMRNLRPMAVFYMNPDLSCQWFHNLIIRYHEITPEALAQTKEVLDKIAPDRDLAVVPLQEVRLDEYKDTLNVRNAILIGGVVTLLIALIGLIGYTIDEVKRRSKEIAVRRVNGALFSEIRRMFINDILKLAVPSAVAGCVLAGIAASRWEQQFIIQAGLPWWVFVLTFTTTIVLVVLLSDLYVNNVANSNPAESLKTE